MKTTKMSLANIQGKLSRTEMKNIMAGSGTLYCSATCSGGSTGTWVYNDNGGSGVSLSTCGNDIHTYCSSGQGLCIGC